MNPVFLMLVMLVMSSLMLLLWLQGMGWTLPTMADLPIGITAENPMLASVAATELQGRLKELSGCSICSSGMYSRKCSSKLPWWSGGCAIAGSVPVEWSVLRIMPQILSIFLPWTSGKKEQKSVSRPRNTSVNAFFLARLLFVVSQWHCSTPPRPKSGGTLHSPVFQADSWCRLVVMLWVMNVRLTLWINDWPFIPMCWMP